MRIVAYVDGHNLYHGLRDAGWRRFLWLNLHGFVQSFLSAHQHLVAVKYFTALMPSVPDDPHKNRRQTAFLEALEIITGIRPILGKMKRDTWRCEHCGKRNRMRTEKKTDVNIAVEMLTDAYRDAFDTALLVSGDTDLVPPIETIRCLFGKRTITVFPPRRSHRELTHVSAKCLHVDRRSLSRNQLPDRVQKSKRVFLCRPAEWMAQDTDPQQSLA
jgi:uncharacterized LabA/DUF88 family protein